MVSPRNPLVVLCLTLWALSILPLQPAQADVVLMRNGSLLEGEIRQGKNSVFVSGPGSEIRLREADVATVVRSRQEAYEWLRNRRAAEARTVDDCLGLAEWCLRQEMWPEASRELLEARRSAPQSKRVALIERRLMLLSQKTQIEPKEVEPKGGIQLAFAEEPSPDKPAEGTSLDKPLVLPEGGLKHFTRHIQPLLVNNCSTSGCHANEGAESFSLDRRLLYGYANARSTQHNLRTTLRAIDIKNPAMSPLLTAARGPHHDVIPFRGNRREEWLTRIEAWITAVAAAQPDAVAAASPEEEFTQVTHEEPVAETITANADRLRPDKLRPAKLTVGGVLTPLKPRDEFDPEVFNRTHRRPEDDLPAEPRGR